MMLGRYLGAGKHGGLYLVSGCVLSVKVQPSGLLQELSWLMLAHPLFPVKLCLAVRASLRKWCLTVRLSGKLHG